MLITGLMMIDSEVTAQNQRVSGVYIQGLALPSSSPPPSMGNSWELDWKCPAPVRPCPRLDYNLHFYLFIFIYFIFGCIGSSLLHAGFSSCGTQAS